MCANSFFSKNRGLEFLHRTKVGFILKSGIEVKSFQSSKVDICLSINKKLLKIL